MGYRPGYYCLGTTAWVLYVLGTTAWVLYVLGTVRPWSLVLYGLVLYGHGAWYCTALGTTWVLSVRPWVLPGYCPYGLGATPVSVVPGSHPVSVVPGSHPVSVQPPDSVLTASWSLLRPSVHLNYDVQYTGR